MKLPFVKGKTQNNVLRIINQGQSLNILQQVFILFEKNFDIFFCNLKSFKAQKNLGGVS
jgi:hypothetical protein